MSNKLLGAGWFLMTPEVVARDSRLNKLQQNIYSELYTFQNATPNQPIWISNNKLADKYDVVRESISRAISKLVDYGYIKRELVYKENSKQVDRRLIRVVPIDEVINMGSDQSVNRVVTDTSIGWCPQRQGGSDHSVKENIPSNIPINKPNTIMSSSNEHDQSVSDITKKLIDKINQLSGAKYRVTDKAKRMVKARLKDYTEIELMNMLDYVWKSWESWNERAKYFRPQTLFAPSKTDEYVAKMQAEPVKKESDSNDWLSNITEAADNA